MQAPQIYTDFKKSKLIRVTQYLCNRTANRLCPIILTLISCQKPPQHTHTNSLIHEKSAYLLQHAHNPVNWQSWNETALQQAQKQQKLVVISIGYAACHWCHVMEKESFSDTQAATLMNKGFINIKIDREERPDIDQVYLTACQMMNLNGCGWPVNVIALPDGKPVWVGSYLPKNEWLEKLIFFQSAWKNDREKLSQYGELVAKETKPPPPPMGELDIELKNIIENIKPQINYENGGLSVPPSGVRGLFPIPSLFDFLLRYEAQNPDSTLKKGILTTLDRMANGGLYDHIEGGFFRYSTDDEWKVPHFEKMLYDNAQMISLYANAYRHTKNERYKNVAEQTIQFLEKEFKGKSGGFYSSIDADSDGKEGGYYIAESGKVLDLEARKNRPKPKIDKKTITAWNALMLKAYVDAYKALDNEKYKIEAKKSGKYLVQQISNGQIKRLPYENRQGFLDDYAYTIRAFVALYQISFDIEYLKTANQLTETVFKNFKQNEQGLFAYSSDNQLFVKNSVEIVDGVMPSSNAVLADALHDLGILFQNENYTQTASKMLRSIDLQSNSLSYYHWGNVLMKTQEPFFEVCIMGKDAKKVAQAFFNTNNILLMASTKNENLPLLQYKYKSHKTMIYVCQKGLCKIPTENIDEAMKLMK